MDLESVSSLLQETIRVALLVSSPILAAAMGVGLAISILQAATQVNEQSLTFVPKILTVLLLFAVLFPWIMTELVDFGTQLVADRAAGGHR